ncbi:hypothetical protein FOMPIDRAFT_1025827, partial [Fomitopsis schrenkii]
MLSTRVLALRSPYHFFLQPVPPPRPWTKVKTATRSSQPRHGMQLKWTPSGPEVRSKNAVVVLRRFEETLRSLYWRKIALPADESNLTSLPPREYLSALLQPVADLFNQLHSPRVLTTPMRSVSVELCEAIYRATFVAEDLEQWKSGVPYIVSVPDNLFDSHGTVSPTTQTALSKTIEHQP